LEACARAVDECAAHGLPIMVEPLPYHHDPTSGKAKLLDDEDALLRAVAVASGLGSTSTATWLKVPAGKNPHRMLSCTTLPALILGGSPGPDPEATYDSWVEAMDVPNVRGLVVGRALLYPPDGDVAGAIERAAGIVRPHAVLNVS
jgi:DhnA family fructose-bisphosphate aldolase class Ia